MHFLTDHEKAVLMDVLQTTINSMIALENNPKINPTTFMTMYRLLKLIEQSEIALTPKTLEAKPEQG